MPSDALPCLQALNLCQTAYESHLVSSRASRAPPLSSLMTLCFSSVGLTLAPSGASGMAAAGRTQGPTSSIQVGKARLEPLYVSKT